MNSEVYFFSMNGHFREGTTVLLTSGVDLEKYVIPTALYCIFDLVVCLQKTSPFFATFMYFSELESFTLIRFYWMSKTAQILFGKYYGDRSLILVIFKEMLYLLAAFRAQNGLTRLLRHTFKSISFHKPLANLIVFVLICSCDCVTTLSRK